MQLRQETVGILKLLRKDSRIPRNLVTDSTPHTLSWSQSSQWLRNVNDIIPVAVDVERAVRVWAAEEDDAADHVVVGRVPLSHARDRAGEQFN